MACIAAIHLTRVVATDNPEGKWADGWKGPLRVLVQVLVCLIAFGLLFNARELFSILRDLHAQFRLQRKLNWLTRLLRNSNGLATEGNLHRVLQHFKGGDSWTLQRHAMGAIYCLIRANPRLAHTRQSRATVERIIHTEPGFARTLCEVGRDCDLLHLVTLGAKIGAGTVEKRIAPVTSDPACLARWISTHRNPRRFQELQIAVGYDTGNLPYLEERAKFLALYLFVTSTDLGRFQALARKPTRDPNAAYGLLIRGDRIEVKFPGQQPGRRLDFVFPCPREMSRENLAHFLRGIQLFNLGLLLACVEDTCQVFFPGEPLPWFTLPMRRVADAYRHFERSLVALLRQHDAFRDPGMIYCLDPTDHAERVDAFLKYRLEECLYPTHPWIVPLYAEDTCWDPLVTSLRGIEGIMLHQGQVPGKTCTRGLDFIHKVRLMGYDTVLALEEALANPSTEEPSGERILDPFISPTADREATLDYLMRMQQAIAAGQIGIEQLPDPAGFTRTVDYFEKALAEKV
jgi:hypothetical protein